MSSKDSLQSRHDKAEEDLKIIQRQLYEMEEHYMAETLAQGNVIKGWDGLLALTEIKLTSNTRKGKVISDKDRLFSLSSVKFSEDLAKIAKEEEDELNATMPTSY